MLKILHRWPVYMQWIWNVQNTFNLYLSLPTCKELLQDLWLSSSPAACSDQAAYVSEIPDQYPKSSNLIKTSFLVGKTEHACKNLDMIALHKYIWLLSWRFLFPFFWSATSQNSSALYSAQYREEACLALLVLLLPRTPQKKKGKKTKAKAKSLLLTTASLISGLD